MLQMQNTPDSRVWSFAKIQIVQLYMQIRLRQKILVSETLAAIDAEGDIVKCTPELPELPEMPPFAPEFQQPPHLTIEVAKL
ncbi:hypothetical protein E4U54_008176 [Claviceps lovelessii]|nr:hypothetical protein E4U54_008176 [Claviceps lovelessii]